MSIATQQTFSSLPVESGQAVVATANLAVGASAVIKDHSYSVARRLSFSATNDSELVIRGKTGGGSFVEESLDNPSASPSSKYDYSVVESIENVGATALSGFMVGIDAQVRGQWIPVNYHIADQSTRYKAVISGGGTIKVQVAIALLGRDDGYVDESAIVDLTDTEGIVSSIAAIRYVAANIVSATKGSFAILQAG